MYKIASQQHSCFSFNSLVNDPLKLIIFPRLSKLCRDLLNGLVLRFRDLEEDVDDEQELDDDEDGEHVGAHPKLE